MTRSGFAATTTGPRWMRWSGCSLRHGEERPKAPDATLRSWSAGKKPPRWWRNQKAQARLGATRRRRQAGCTWAVEREDRLGCEQAVEQGPCMAGCPSHGSDYEQAFRRIPRKLRSWLASVVHLEESAEEKCLSAGGDA